MGSGSIDWSSAIGVLAVGLVLGAVFVWRMRTAGATTPADTSESLEHRDLLSRREVLFRQIAELEATAAKRSPEQLAQERYALELDAARVLQGLDRHQPAPAQSVTTPAGATPVEDGTAAEGQPALRGFLWGTGSMVAVAGLIFFVTQAARPRDPGGSVTGDLPTSSQAEPVAAEEQELQAAVARNPDDLDARLALAQSYLQRQDMMGVWNETQFVLDRSPGHPRALSYQALVRLAMGQADLALEMLEEAIAAAPELPDPYVPLTLVQLRLGRHEDAAQTMAEARRRFPERAEALAAIEKQLKASGGEMPAPLEGDPHAGIAPRSPERAAAEPSGDTVATRVSGTSVAGVVDIDPALRSQTSRGVLYLILREAGIEGGPPIAVQRLVPESLPLRFEISAADSMTGEELPDELRVEARLDSDGDPSTRPPSDPRALEEQVKLGTSDLRLVLTRGD